MCFPHWCVHVVTNLDKQSLILFLRVKRKKRVKNRKRRRSPQEKRRGVRKQGAGRTRVGISH